MEQRSSLSTGAVSQPGAGNIGSVGTRDDGLSFPLKLDLHDRIREPRRETPRHELRPLELTGPRSLSGLFCDRLHSLLPDAAAASLPVPAMWKDGWRTFQ